MKYWHRPLKNQEADVQVTASQGMVYFNKAVLRGAPNQEWQRGRGTARQPPPVSPEKSIKVPRSRRVPFRPIRRSFVLSRGWLGRNTHETYTPGLACLPCPHSYKLTTTVTTTVRLAVGGSGRNQGVRGREGVKKREEKREKSPLLFISSREPCLLLVNSKNVFKSSLSLFFPFFHPSFRTPRSAPFSVREKRSDFAS